MDADQLLRDGNPREALQALQARVREAPADASLRIFLFQLLAVLGSWDRARTQLDVAGELDASALGMVAVYRQALQAETVRTEVFAGRRTPTVFGEPDEWVALVFEALRLTAIGRDAESQDVRARAFDAAPATAGRIDGQRFEWVADADPRLGPMVEAIVNGRYYWVPFCRIRRLLVEPPTDLRDLVWTPAFITWANGGEAAALIPARYPGSEQSEDPQIQLARRTEWAARGADLYLGLGQRMLATSVGEYPLLEVRQVELEIPGAATTAPAREGGESSG
jgi:type VI secretion system protein ImpE